MEIQTENNRNKNFSLNRINVSYFISMAVLCTFLGFFITRLVIRFQNYYESSQQYFSVSKAALKLQEGSDYLTEEARLFIISADKTHMENYLDEVNLTHRREEGINELEELHFDQNIIDSLKASLDESYSLEQKEFYAMKLMILGRHFENSSDRIPDVIMNIKLSPEDEALSDDYKVAKAWLIMFSQEYVEQKKTISAKKEKAITEVFDKIESNYEKSINSLKELFVDIIILVILVIIITGIFVLSANKLIIYPINKMIKNIQNGTHLDGNATKELDILSKTYNQILDKNIANEILLKHKAEHDELTGLMNRTAYNQIKEVLTASTDNIALLMIDVDSFKKINDTYGHMTGDKVLKKVASVLEKTFRVTDYTARIGGDEFAVILTGCDPDRNKTIELLDAKMKKIRETLLLRDENLPEITLSCGIDLSSNGYSEKLFEHADIALYEVKNSGKNGYKIYNSGIKSPLLNASENNL